MRPPDIRPKHLVTEGGKVVAVELPATRTSVPQKAEVNGEARHLLQWWPEQRKAMGFRRRRSRRR